MSDRSSLSVQPKSPSWLASALYFDPRNEFLAIVPLKCSKKWRRIGFPWGKQWQYPDLIPQGCKKQLFWWHTRCTSNAISIWFSDVSSLILSWLESQKVKSSGLHQVTSKTKQKQVHYMFYHSHVSLYDQSQIKCDYSCTVTTARSSDTTVNQQRKSHQTVCHWLKMMLTGMQSDSWLL